MASRMLCTDCFETSHPQTLLAGSDRIEMVAWLCFALPGWLYCWWRHRLRIKVCGVCGGSSLVREARVAAANDPHAAPQAMHFCAGFCMVPQAKHCTTGGPFLLKLCSCAASLVQRCVRTAPQ